MVVMRETLLRIFKELNERVASENADREESGSLKLRPVEVRVMGQATLLANEFAASVLTLAMTNDLDAVIERNQAFMISVLKKEILPKYQLVLDDDSRLVWVPPGSTFEVLCDLKYVRVKLLDPESALVSKAVKAKEKNKILIVDAIASEKFPNLISRIQDGGGDLEFFIGE